MPESSPSQALQSTEPAELVRFYGQAYSERDPAAAARYARWRALGAAGKADHVVSLCAHTGIAPTSTLEVGCGDGALLAELHHRGFGGRLAGVEITPAAVEIARRRAEIDSVELYDGSQIPCADGTYRLGVLSHVLEHVPEPVAMLGEVARACDLVLVEVPLEDNISARRSSKQAHAAEVGHLQRLSRSAVRELAAQAGLHVLCELDDALPLAVHSFFATNAAGRARAVAKWSARKTLHGLTPPLARRLFTVHYACLCSPEE